jgi:cytochrome c biogenesis protein CcmG/thiol:disulfide interchange protein DsbE
MLRRWLPLLVFLALGALLFAGVRLSGTRNPNEIPSPLIGKPAPDFALPLLHDPARTVTRADLLGRPYVLNVWGSWCPSCRIEHPFVEALAKTGRIRVIGFNYKDEREDALRWLGQFGDPYEFSLVDLDGRKAIDFGVSAAPETYVIDAQGIVRYKHTGPLTPADIEAKILPWAQADGAAQAADAATPGGSR